MKLTLHLLSSKIVQVASELTSYTIFQDGEVINFIGPGVEEEYDISDFPGEEPELLAISAYLIASLEAKLYGE